MRAPISLIFLVTLLLPFGLSPAVAASSGVVTGQLSDDEKMVREWAERVQPLLYDRPYMIVWRYCDINPRTSTYLPEQRTFVIGADCRTVVDLKEVTPRGVLLSTPMGALELRLSDPSLIDYDGQFFLYHSGKLYKVATYVLASAVVTRITPPWEWEDIAAFNLPDDLESRYPDRADVEFELSREACVLRYYYINPDDPHSYLELVVRLDLNTERPEFTYRVVYDPERTLELLGTYEEFKRKWVDYVIVHSLEGTRVIGFTVDVPRDAPFVQFIKRTSNVCSDVFQTPAYKVPIFNLLGWWLEWRLKWSNVQLPPGEGPYRHCHDLLTQPWLAIVPDLLAAASSLMITLPLVRFENWWFGVLKPVSERLRAYGQFGRFLAAVTYYAPVGLLEEILGRFVLPCVVRTVLTLLKGSFPWIGSVDASWLADRALYCAVVPIVDVTAMHRVTELAGSPVTAALAFVFLDTLWSSRSELLHNPISCLLNLLIIPYEFVRTYLCTVFSPPVAAILCALMNSGVRFLPWPEVDLNVENQHRLFHALLVPLLEQLTERLAPVG